MRFDYGLIDRNTDYTTPLSGSYQYVYDKDRRLIQTVFPSGRTIDSTFLDGLLRTVDMPEGQILYEYACGSKGTCISMGTESLGFTYDGSLLTSITQAGELSATLGMAYDVNGALTAITYAGETTSLSYDRDGLAQQIGDFTIARNADNALPEAVSDGALQLAREFNGYGEVTKQEWSINGASVFQYELERNENGQIIRKTETLGNSTVVYDYTYDALNRLTRVEDGNGTLLEAYTYGHQGERLTQFNLYQNIGNRTFGYDEEDRLLRAGDATYTYDVDGFLTQKVSGGQTTTYTYSSRGETKEVDLGNGTVVTYAHDVQGRPVAKSINGEVVEKYLWSGRTKLLAIYNKDNVPQQRFEYGGSRLPVAMSTPEGRFYFAYDQVGSLRAVADESGSVVKTVRYDSFGNIISDPNPELRVPFGFAGGLHDRDTGLVRFGARDYDPVVGRWTAKDPILFEGKSASLYEYCDGNPVNRIDPDGLESKNPAFDPMDSPSACYSRCLEKYKGFDEYMDQKTAESFAKYDQMTKANPPKTPFEESTVYAEREAIKFADDAYDTMAFVYYPSCRLICTLWHVCH